MGRSLAFRLGGLGLEVCVLARVEVEELGVCEEGQVLLKVQAAVFHSIRPGADGVEVAKILRHVGAVPTAVIRHDDFSVKRRWTGFVNWCRVSQSAFSLVVDRF